MDVSQVGALEDGEKAQLLPVGSFDLIVFGAAGDLAQRKLIPSLFHRWRDGQIPEASRLIGVSRTQMTDEAFRTQCYESFCAFYPGDCVEPEEWARFAGHLRYASIDAASEGADWSDLAEQLKGRDAVQRVFYLALPPAIYGAVSHNLNKAGLKSPGARIVLEKPIGKDLKSAKEVNDAVGAVFDEDAIFRIDHYLGKETVQNL
ncbi:MAG: glucose-6-phosphate dehydrogenase, partial [Pseudomonadota bacterium]